MYKLEELKELMQMLDQTSLEELELKTEKFSLKLRKGGTMAAPSILQVPVPSTHVEAASPIVAAPPANNFYEITSPMVGTFYAASAPGVPPYVKVGQTVYPDSVVCIIEAMKLMNELEAEIQGEIAEILVENGQIVEYGQPLFLVKPSHAAK